MVYHKKNGESIGLMDGYYVVGVIAIPYPGFGVIINIISKEGVAYHVIIDNILQRTCLDFIKMSSHALKRIRK
jgi:hypothetical protein